MPKFMRFSGDLTDPQKIYIRIYYLRKRASVVAENFGTL